jgi:predicted nucleic acid-binding protein
VKFLLDTCVFSELRRRDAEPNVVEWALQTDESRMYVSVVTLGEIQKGIAKLEDGRRKVALQSWLEQDLAARFRGRVLGVGAETALTWGTLQGEAERKGGAVPVIDCLVAAIAVTHNLALVTRNVRDFERLPVRVFNPWTIA